MRQKHNNKTTRFLSTSLVLVLTLSLAIFSFLAFFLNRQSASSIREVSRMYMSSMSEQIAMHFETVISLRMDQLDALVGTAAAGDVHRSEEQRQELIHSAQAREFLYLGFYRTDGTFDTLYGSEPAVVDPEPFLRSLTGGEKKAAVATAPNGDRLVLLGIPTAHGQNGGDGCAALVAALPVSYITDTLSLNENSATATLTGCAASTARRTGRRRRPISGSWRTPSPRARTTPPRSAWRASSGRCTAPSWPTPSGTC